MPQQHYEVSIHYEYWKTGELRRSAKQRHIPLGSRKASRKALIRALRSADENPRLDRFFGLPIELRLQIYEAYCSDCTKQTIFTEATPPLARANRQLRSEFLPVFDKECTFGVSFSRSGSATVQTQSRLLKLLNAPQSTLLLNSHATWARYADRHKGSESFERRVSLDHGRYIMAAERKQKLEAMLTSFTREIEQRDAGRDHLAVSELNDLLRMIEKVLVPHVHRIDLGLGIQVRFTTSQA